MSLDLRDVCDRSRELLDRTYIARRPAGGIDQRQIILVVDQPRQISRRLAHAERHADEVGERPDLVDAADAVVVERDQRDALAFDQRGARGELRDGGGLAYTGRSDEHDRASACSVRSATRGSGACVVARARLAGAAGAALRRRELLFDELAERGDLVANLVGAAAVGAGSANQRAQRLELATQRAERLLDLELGAERRRRGCAWSCAERRRR